MATMHQAATATREFAREFSILLSHAHILGILLKVNLVSALNQDTLTCLDTYVTMHGGDEMARLETIQDQLHWIPYI